MSQHDNTCTARVAPTRRHFSCRLPHLSNSTPQKVPQQTAGRGTGIARLSHRHLVSLSGADAAKFLQGLVTNNVNPDNHSSFYTAFLDARGRVLWDVFIYVLPERVRETGQWECYIEVDETEKEALKKHLKRHKLRSKVKIEDVEDIHVRALWGIDPTALDAADAVLIIQDPRGPDGRLYRVLGRIQDKNLSSVQDYQRMRYQYGIPEGPHEITRESALPMEYNIDLSSGIDFKKGCYVGQELTIRTKHTGVVRKRVLPVRLGTGAVDKKVAEVDEREDSHGDTPGTSVGGGAPEPGSDIKQLDQQGQAKKGRAVGKYIAGIGDIGLALCRLEMMTSMKVSGEGGSWRPGMEFGIETNGGIVKVEPILHDWMLLRESTLWGKNRSKS